jgi:hypothetical protein
MFEIAGGSLSLPEPRSEEGRRRREKETAHIIQAMQFLYDHGRLPKSRRRVNLLKSLTQASS